MRIAVHLRPASRLRSAVEVGRIRSSKTILLVSLTAFAVIKIVENRQSIRCQILKRHVIFSPHQINASDRTVALLGNDDLRLTGSLVGRFTSQEIRSTMDKPDVVGVLFNRA